MGNVGAVMVVGGGIAGVQAALDLADGGYKVYLMEKSPSIGGAMAQLDKTFPTNDCSMCILAPKLVAAGSHPNIELMVLSELIELKGTPGDFTAKVLKKARYVDSERCTGCGSCAKKCPVKVPNEFDVALGTRKAIYVPFPQAVPLKYVRDREHCIKLSKGKDCKGCTSACRANAIMDDDKDIEVEIKVGAVIIAPGFKPFNPIAKKEYGYKIFPNVLTSLEFERMLSASGPTGGKVLRPSDGQPPKNIAFIQCVGSRDINVGNPYCSSVCCMYAIKEAVIAKEHNPGLSAHIFFMDVRAYGKEFEEYRIRAETEYGVRFTRNNRVAAVEEIENNRLRVNFHEGSALEEEEFDMVILSVGLEPTEDSVEMAKVAGISLNEFRFCATPKFTPLKTSKPGIFVCGTFNSPKDIPDTVAQASGSAAEASCIIPDQRNTLVKQREYPPEQEVKDKDARIGVFVCHCGINIGGVVDVPAVVQYAEKLPGVVYAEGCIYACSQDTQKHIKEMIKNHSLSRIVVASCTPRTHEALFRETVREAGLNPYLFEMANIRDQCSWVHMHQPREATEKAKDLVRMATAKARNLEPLSRVQIPVTKSALVIGGGLSGMVSALSLAGQGFPVHLIEKENELGGNLRRVTHTLTGENPIQLLKDCTARVESNPLIKVHRGAGSRIEAIDGYVGNFATTLADGTTIKHGVVIVASGGIEYRPDEYLYGKNPKVVTQLELEELMDKGLPPLKSVAIIQCVGSRNKTHPECSRICCSTSIKNAIRLKEINPDTAVYILFKDIRTYGFRELYYLKASQKGVLFIRYDDTHPIEVAEEDGVFSVKVFDQFTETLVKINPDMLVLNAAVRPSPSNQELAKLLKVPLSKEGYFLEAHVKLRPMDFATEGVFVCGLAHSPKFIDESICQAHGAAARAATILAKDTIYSEAVIAVVDESRCRGCGKCEEVCEYKAPQVIKLADGRQVARINEALCKGCGVCSVQCCNKSITMKHFKTESIIDMIDAALAGSSRHGEACASASGSASGGEAK